MSFLAPCVRTVFLCSDKILVQLTVSSRLSDVSQIIISPDRQERMSLPGMDERFLAADSRVAEWSMGGAMFGLTAAVVQMLIRSLIVKRDNVS